MEIQTKITARYVKSPSYDAHPLHGVYGGINSSGLITMAVYSESHKLPESAELTLELGPDGQPTGVNEVVSDNTGIERLIHGTYFLDLNMARVLVDWLNDKIKAHENLNGGQRT